MPSVAPWSAWATRRKASSAKFASYPNLAFSLAKLVPGTPAHGNPSKWVSYIVTTVETNSAVPAPQRPGTDNTGTLVDNGDGSYKYTFYRDIPGIKAAVAAMAASAVAASANNNVADLGDLTYDASLTHRLTIQFSGNAPGTGTNTPTGATSAIAGVPLKKPYDAIYDFIPATGAKVTATDFSRDIVANTNCEACHRKLGGIPGLSSAEDAAAFHGGGRNNVQYCAVCHTDQRKYGRAEATATLNGAVKTFTPATGNAYKVDGRAIGNLPNLIHKVHASKLLVHKNYDYADVKLNEPTYPQDIRNCTSCHDGSTTVSRTTKTKDGNNWKKVPTALACGSCHDGINFATGTGVTLRDAAAGLTSSNINNTGIAHPAGPLADDSQLRAVPQVQRHVPAGRHRPEPLPGDAAEPQSNFTAAAAAATPTPIRRGSPRALPSGAAPGRDRGHVRRQERLAQCEQAAGDGVPDAAKSSRTNERHCRRTQRLRHGDAPTRPPATRRSGTTSWGRRAAYFVFAVPQDGIAAPADFNASRLYRRWLWDGTADLASAPAPQVRSALPRARWRPARARTPGTTSSRSPGCHVPDNAVMLTGGMGYSYNVTNALPLTQTNLAGYPVTAATAARTDQQGRRPDRDRAQRAEGGHRLHRPPRDRRGRTLQRLPPGTRHLHRRRVPRRPTQRRHDLLVVPHAEPDQQRLVGGLHGLRPRHPRVGQAADPVHLARQLATEPAASAEITYPGILNDCQTCHLPGTFDFSATASANAVGQGADQLTSGCTEPCGTGTYAAAAGTSHRSSSRAYGYRRLARPMASGFSFNQCHWQRRRRPLRRRW